MLRSPSIADIERRASRGASKGGTLSSDEAPAQRGQPAASMGTFDELRHIQDKVNSLTVVSARDVFETVARLENLIEAHKLLLVNSCPDYNTIDAFRLIDEAGQGKVTQSQIADFVQNNFGA
jgi:hypothetical protein